jgi:hypothetical protein
MGSLFLYILIQPLYVFFLRVFVALFKDKNSCRKVKQYSHKRLRDFCWNDCLAFYTENYLVLSCVGWLGMFELRFGKNYQDSENFSSVLAIFLTVFSVTYPLFIAIFYLKNYKPLLRTIKIT